MLILRPARAIAFTSAPSTTSPILISMIPNHIWTGHRNRDETHAIRQARQSRFASDENY